MYEIYIIFNVHNNKHWPMFDMKNTVISNSAKLILMKFIIIVAYVRGV